MNDKVNYQLNKYKNNDLVFLPAEAKVCATCSYWDGERKVDEDTLLVVVKTSQQGKCLVKEQAKFALSPKHLEYNCLWEDLQTTDNNNNDDNNNQIACSNQQTK